MPTSTVKFRVMNCEKICQTNNLYWRPVPAPNEIFRYCAISLWPVAYCVLWDQRIATYHILYLNSWFLEIPDESSPDLSDRGRLSKSLSSSLASTMSTGNTEAQIVNGEVAEDGKIPICGEVKDPNVKVTLQNKEIWDKFHACGTEMIITKAGRLVTLLTLIPINI